MHGNWLQVDILYKLVPEIPLLCHERRFCRKFCIPLLLYFLLFKMSFSQKFRLIFFKSRPWFLYFAHLIQSDPMSEFDKMSTNHGNLTLSLPIATVMPYANSLDPDETPSNSASHPEPSYLTLGQYFHKLWTTLKHPENCSRRNIEQTIFSRQDKG